MKKHSLLLIGATLLTSFSALAGTSVQYKCNPIPGVIGRMDTNSYTIERDRSENGPEKIYLLVNGKKVPVTIAPSLPGEMKYSCDTAEFVIPANEMSVISIKSKVSSYSADCVRK